VAILLGSVPTGAQQGARVQACDEPDRTVTLYATRLGPGRLGYGLSPSTARIPGPTLQMTEGECLAVKLVNRTDKRVSVHPHGVDYTVASDGTRLNSSCTKPGTSRTYFLSTHEPSRRGDGSVEPGSAGYWHYHDHCDGSPHGTGGVNAGLFGALIVRRPGDPEPDRKPFVLVMGPGARFNLRSAPHTPVLQANQGERVEFVVITHGDLIHTFHLHGHRWADNRTGIPAATDDPVNVIDNITSGPGDSFGFQVIAGEEVGPGAWMYHCHVQSHSDAGMSGLFVVRDPTGRLTPDARTVLEHWSMGHIGHH
jgi:manganese oxidase